MSFQHHCIPSEEERSQGGIGATKLFVRLQYAQCNLELALGSGIHTYRSLVGGGRAGGGMWHC